MLNLLPVEEKQKIRHEYKVRFVIVAGVLLCASILLSVAYLLPSYFLSQTKEKSVSERVTLIRSSIDAQEENSLNTSIQEVSEKAALLKPIYSLHMYEIFQRIIEKKNSAIKILHMTLVNNNKEGEEKEITLSGIASSREDLIAFTKALEQESLFSRVELPVSNLARNKDIDFSLSIFGKF